VKYILLAEIATFNILSIFNIRLRVTCRNFGMQFSLEENLSDEVTMACGQ